MSHLSPGMRQYMEVKQKHPDCIVLFRMGDFYEIFYSDAKTAAKELDITLTSRGKGEKKAPLAGIPYHSAQPYIAKLVKRGYKVCMVEQTEDPKKAKGLVKRDVVRIITPGTLIDEMMLPDKSNNYIAALNKEKDAIGLAIADISTGEFFVLATTSEKIDNELNKYQPSEVIIPLSLEKSDFAQKLKHYCIHTYDDLHFFEKKAEKTLEGQCNIPFTQSSEYSLLVSSAGALIAYLKETQLSDLSHITKLQVIQHKTYMFLDKTTIANLNILPTSANDVSLLKTIDQTKTSMGSRLLRQWLVRPLLTKEKIVERQKAVQELYNNRIMKEDIAEILSEFHDLERLMSRVSFRNASPKDLVSLRMSLSHIPHLNNILTKTKSRLLQKKLEEFTSLKELLSNAILDEPNTIIREGNIIRDGFNKELDDLRKIKKNTREWIAEFEKEEKEKTGIKFLRVSYNKVFGYFIEVSKSNLNLVPDHYIRKQTQTNSERYITPELKDKEQTIMTADERIKELECNLFMEIIDQVSHSMAQVLETSSHIACIDVLQSFASIALANKYVCPELNDDGVMAITEGRHPIVESREDLFIPNDLTMNDQSRMHIITGPNMAGKSVYIKQNALIVIMAHIGSFVPAKTALVSITDRIFSRVGASDDIASGRSTFMVEMHETANILTNATEKSFIILDEIGRGTSTYDGVSLAWAIAEYILKKIKAKTLFATHYHQLNKLADDFAEVHNFNIAVSEKEDSIVFLRKIVAGGTDRSYGIHVAKLAGLPSEVIETSKKIITQLEMEDDIGAMLHKGLKKVPVPSQNKEIKQSNEKIISQNNLKEKSTSQNEPKESSSKESPQQSLLDLYK